MFKVPPQHLRILNFQIKVRSHDHDVVLPCNQSASCSDPYHTTNDVQDNLETIWVNFELSADGMLTSPDRTIQERTDVLEAIDDDHPP